MKSWLRHFLPYGLVRYSQLSSELQDLGIERAKARRISFSRDAAARLERANLDLLPKDALKAVDCVIDIGANVGDWAANLLFFCQPDFLLCVEPDPDLANQLRRRFAKNRTVHVEEAAMGDSSKVAELRLMHNPALNSLRQPTITMAALFPEPFQPAGSVQVAVKTLDAVAPRDRRINLLKIDAQGFEREVLNGAKETLKRTDIVIIEVNLQPHYDGEAGIFELDAIMQQHGFCIGNYSEPKGGRRQALFADAVYVRRES